MEALKERMESEGRLVTTDCVCYMNKYIRESSVLHEQIMHTQLQNQQQELMSQQLD